jgi:hypothetical protein
VALECALEYARAQVERQQHRLALERLQSVSELAAVIGSELQARVHYWRSVALDRSGDNAAAARELASGKRLMAQIREALPAEYRDRFASRATIRPLME